MSPSEASEIWPLMRSDDVIGGVFLPNDAKANPADITQALARGARTGGVTIRQAVKVTGFALNRGRVTGVETSQGPVECEYVVNCAGQWAKAVAAMAGVVVPLYPAEHFYVVTGPLEGLTRATPTFRDPDGFTYFKEEVGGLLMGGFEPDAKPWLASEEIPNPLEFQLLPEDWQQFGILMQNAMSRVPAMATVGIRKLVNGPESFTPDHNFIMGESPEVEGFFVAAGFNSSGIGFSGGAGAVLARWIVDGEPDLDVTPVDIRRFAHFQGNRQWLRARVKEIVGLHFAMAWPNREPESARPLRRSPVHHILQARGPVPAQSSVGNYQIGLLMRATPSLSTDGDDKIGSSSARPNTEPLVRERRFVRPVFIRQVLARGSDVETLLQFLCTNDIAVPVAASFTQVS